MKALSKKLAQSEDGSLWFFCPGCDSMVRTLGWQFDGNVERPTLSPSVLSTCEGHRCHSFVRDGRIQFLDDCTHELAGQTVDLPDLPAWILDGGMNDGD